MLVLVIVCGGYVWVVVGTLGGEAEGGEKGGRGTDWGMRSPMMAQVIRSKSVPHRREIEE